MLVTSVGGLPEMVPHHNAGYVTEINSHAIADCLVDFYEKRREEEFVKNVKEEKKRFEWSSFVNGVELLFQRIK